MTLPEPSTVETTHGSTRPEDRDQAPTGRTLGHQDDHALSPRVLALWRTGSVIAASVSVVLALVAAVAATDLPVLARIAIPFLVALAAVVLVAWLPAAIYRSWSYRLTGQSLELRHGVIVRHQSSVPYFRVQHVDVRRGLVQGWFGVVSLTVSTASPATDAELPGLEPERAEAIRRRILDRTEADDGV